MNDYKYLRLAAHDTASIGDGPLVKRDIPYCLINSDRYFLPATRIVSQLHKTDPSFRMESEIDSLKDFISRLDTSKIMWRSPRKDTVRPSPMTQTTIHLSTSTHSTMKNTGLGELVVGDTIYAMPAISYLAKNNPSVNTFTWEGNMYLHPMILNWQERYRLTEDVLTLQDSIEHGKTFTLIGGMLKKHAGKGYLDLDKLLIYLRLMRPVGVVMYNLEGNRRSIYDVTQNVVSLGSNFICLNNLFN